MANTPAGPKVTGAVGIFPFVGTNRTAAFLGYGREAPRIQRKHGWVPFFNDLGGPIISFDDVFAGEESLVSVTLNYWRSDTLAGVESVPTSGGATFTNPFGDIGALAIFEGKTYPLVLTFPYAAKPAYRTAGLPAGVRFYAARLEGPTLYTPGTVPLEINLIWKCKAVFQPATGAFVSGDRNIAGLPPAI